MYASTEGDTHSQSCCVEHRLHVILILLSEYHGDWFIQVVFGQSDSTWIPWGGEAICASSQKEGQRKVGKVRLWFARNTRVLNSQPATTTPSRPLLQALHYQDRSRPFTLNQLFNPTRATSTPATNFLVCSETLHTHQQVHQHECRWLRYVRLNPMHSTVVY